MATRMTARFGPSDSLESRITYLAGTHNYTKRHLEKTKVRGKVRERVNMWDSERITKAKKSPVSKPTRAASLRSLRPLVFAGDLSQFMENAGLHRVAKSLFHIQCNRITIRRNGHLGFPLDLILVPVDHAVSRLKIELRHRHHLQLAYKVLLRLTLLAPDV